MHDVHGGNDVIEKVGEDDQEVDDLVGVDGVSESFLQGGGLGKPTLRTDGGRGGSRGSQ
jgi:hypothetical protein